MKENQIVNYNFGQVSHKFQNNLVKKMHQKLLVSTSTTDSCNRAELYMSLNFRGGGGEQYQIYKI